MNVIAPAPKEVKSTLKNSLSPRFVPAKVSVIGVADRNRTIPEPASHTAESVDEFVHEPSIIHVSEPKSIAEEADEMLTLPVIETAPDVEVRSPPLIVNEPAVNVRVFLASVPPEIVSALVTIQLLPIVTVPDWTVITLIVLSEDSNVTLCVPLN